MLLIHGAAVAGGIALMLMIVLCIIIGMKGNGDSWKPADVLKLLSTPPGPTDVYTYVPTPLAPDQLQQLYPSNLQLMLLQVVHRHGERTPTGNHLPGLEENIRGWKLCWTPDVEEEFFLRKYDSSPYRYLILDDNGHPTNHSPGVCNYGQLTDKGKRSMFRIGVYLRYLYVDQLHFLASKWTSSHQVFIRATDVPRTHHSVLSLLMGLYPKSHRSNDLPVPQVFSMPPAKEYLHPIDACPKELQEWVSSQESDPTMKAKVEQLRETYPAVQRWLDMCPPPSSPGGYHPIAAVEDTFTSLVAHGLALPDGITADAMRDIKAVSNQDGYRPFEVSHTLTHLMSGRLINELLSRFDNAVSGTLSPQLALYSVHDVTVAPLLCALGVFDGLQPRFASMVSMELLASTTIPRDFFLRLWYNGHVLPLPFCPDAQAPLFTCPWPVARTRLVELQLSAAEYSAQCQLK